MSKWKWLNDLMLEKGLTQADLAKILDWPSTRISELFSDKRDIPARRLDAFADFFNLDYKELRAYNENITTKIPSIKNYKSVVSDTASIKIIDVVACCGTGIEAIDENIIGTFDIPLQKFKDITSATPSNVRMLQVSGDSMQPTLNSGDWALADISQNFISSDGLYLIRTASGISIKRILSGLNDISIISDNPNYPNLTASVGEVYIIGKVIYTLNAKKVG